MISPKPGERWRCKYFNGAVVDVVTVWDDTVSARFVGGDKDGVEMRWDRRTFEKRWVREGAA